MKKSSLRLQTHYLSLKHKNAEDSRKALEIAEAMKSNMSIDRMQRLESVAINNRCLFQYSKIKRAEESSKRYTKRAPFLPNMKKLRLEVNTSTSPKNKKEKARSMKKYQTFQTEEQKLFQQLIDEYIEKVKQTRNIQTLGSHDELVKEACRQICKKIEQRKQSVRLGTISKRTSTEGVQILTSSRHLKKPSVSDFQFEENIERVRRSKLYGEKQRKLNERLFLRKLKILNKLSRQGK